MPRQSSIKRLPREIQARIGLLFEQGFTLDEMLAALEENNVRLSRSALHRHKQSIEKVAEKVHRSRAVAEALVQRFGTEPESKTTRLNVELTHSVILDLLTQADDQADDQKEGQKANKDSVASPMGAMLLAKALEHLAKAKRQDAELITKIREEAAKEARDKAAQAAENAGKQLGMTKEQAAFIRAEILGVEVQR